ncbi:MAG: LamG-like jellyroll fold domain-containing protein [Nitrospirota bacterium]
MRLKTTTIIVIIGFIATILSSFIVFAAIDTPHNASNNINCGSCHGQALLNSPFWGGTMSYDQLCLGCHTASSGPYSDISAPLVQTHSSANTSNQYGDWSRECRNCHDPHYQRQKFYKSTDAGNLYLATGTITGCVYNGDGTSTLTYSTITYKSGWDSTKLTKKTLDFRRTILFPNVGKLGYNYPVVAIDTPLANTITVSGDATPVYEYISSSTFAAMYGQYIKDIIDLSGTSKTVKFFDQTGTNSFADGDTTYNGVCEVCHTQTKHFQNTGGGSDPLHINVGVVAGTNCITCHRHESGFGHGGTTGCGTSTVCHATQGSHNTHTSSVQLNLECSECHNMSDMPKFRDGTTSKAATTVCNNCHSSNGVSLAKQYWSYPGSSSGTAGSWAVVEGEKSFCGSCHDSTPGNSSGYGTGDNAINILGDDTTYGFYITGHGKASGNYARLSYQDTASSGNPAGNRKCSNCHNLNTAHYNNTQKRLQGGNDQNNSNCNLCHSTGGSADATPKFYMNSTDYENSAHNGKLCTECHDVHGMINWSLPTYAGMTKGDKTNLCNQCHSGIGGHPGAGSTTFTIDGKNYTLQCISCHNVHVVTGTYAQADQNKSPLTRFAHAIQNQPQIWGDVAGEKMNAYAGSGTYRKPNGELFTGDQLPDYATFCLDCHGTGGTNHETSEPSPYFRITWDGDPHGRQAANQPSGYGVCPNWFACGKAFGWTDDDCTGSQADCWPVIPRGEGDELFSREPYTHKERVAGANFTLSCTDCHTGHGSGTLSRPKINNVGPFSNWNNTCNYCHYYYSDWHADMACGNASCHEQNSLHRFKKYTGGGGPRTHESGLVLHYAFENNLKDSGGWEMDGKWYSTAGSFTTGKVGQAAVFGEDIGIQVGTENSSWSTDEGAHGTWKYTEMKYNTTLEAWVYPTDNAKSEYTIFNKHVGVSNNGGYAFTLKKIGGSLRATFTIAADNNSGTQDGRTGVRGAYSAVAIPLNKWTHVAATFDTSGPDRNPSDPSVGRIRIYVNGEDVTTSDSSGNWMQPGANETSIYAYSENSPWNQGICYDGHWCASEFSICGFDWEATNFIGRIDEAKVWNVTKPVSYFDAIDASIAPQIASVVKGSTPDKIVVTFSKGVYTNNNQTGSLVLSDFVFTCSHGKSITAVTHTAGSNTATLTVSPVLNYNDINVDTVAAAANQIFDRWGNAIGTTAVTIGGDDGVAPTIASAIVSGAKKITVTFSEGVYADTGGTGAIVPSDFVYTDLDNGRTITAVAHTGGSSTAILILSSNLDSSNDIGVDTVAAASNQIFDDMSRTMPTTAVTITGSLCPPVPVTFQLNEASGSTTAQDDQGFLIGAVTGSNSFQGDGYYHGSGTSSNYITFTDDTCLQATTAMTIEARIKPDGLSGVTGDYIGRIIALDNTYNYQLSVWKKNDSTNWPNYTPPAGTASIALWVRTDSDHGYGDYWKGVLTDYSTCPIVSDHWYQVKAVWNTNKPGGTPGQFFVPADIYVDDQGTDGNGAGENWSGYINCTNSSQSYSPDKKKLFTGDTITPSSGIFRIGASAASTPGNFFNGLIDWITWKDSVE